jgi:hypothetical protein
MLIWLNMIRALVISLLSAGRGWAVVWSDGSCVDTKNFVHREDAEKFWRELSCQNPNAIRYLQGTLI